MLAGRKIGPKVFRRYPCGRCFANGGASIRNQRSVLGGGPCNILLGLLPEPTSHPDPEHRAAVRDHLRKVIVGAQMLDVPIVGTFAGRDRSKNLPDNLEMFAEVWPPLVKFAADHGVKIAIENCPMIFSYDEWPGGDNLKLSIRSPGGRCLK